MKYGNVSFIYMSLDEEALSEDLGLSILGVLPHNQVQEVMGIGSPRTSPALLPDGSS